MIKDSELIEQKCLQNAKLLKLIFPKFWIDSYKNKNRFFHYVYDEAKQHIEERGLSEEFLEEDYCKKLWERHCDFCFEEITTDILSECYCTEDCYTWLCTKCFHEHKAKYGWQVSEIQDIPENGVLSMSVKITK